jgi:hypothetical protein
MIKGKSKSPDLLSGGIKSAFYTSLQGGGEVWEKINDNFHLPIMYLAFCMADLVQSTLVPREQNPCLSGGLTDTRAISRLIIYGTQKIHHKTSAI